VRNLIDAAWDFLKGLGEWLWSIGEMIYDSLVWLMEAISEYGAILLGLAIVFVALAIVFFGIYYQLKLWLMGLALAKGDYDRAAAHAGEVTSNISKGLGKLKGD